MEMPGHAWPGTLVEFLGMWIAMMAAMMLPSIVPTLLRYRQSLGKTTLVGLGYFFVWAIVGTIAYASSVALALSEMHLPAFANAVPSATGIVVLAAGALQFTEWKARHLRCCRRGPWYGRSCTPDRRTAWQDGLRFGLHCVCSCAGPTVILLVAGMMDLRVMAILTAGITLERLLPSGERVARVLGVASVAAGCVLVA
jgi:predicted metal-binding membrane protein